MDLVWAAYSYLPVSLRDEFISCVGVPEEVIKRAASMLEAIGQNKHVQRLCNEHIAAQDQLYTVLILKPSFDMTTGDIIYSSYSFVIYIPLHFLLSV